MTIKIEDSLTFSDVLLKPKFSKIKSRSEVSLKVKINDFIFSNPIIPANMPSIVGKEVLEFCAEKEMLCFMHRFSSVDNQLTDLHFLNERFGEKVFNNIGVSLGVKKEDKENLSKFIDAGVKIFCIDIAHGHSQMCLDMIKFIRSHTKTALVVAGNVATKHGAQALWTEGADIVKVGIGSSKICTTRLVAGSGVPQLSALIDIVENKSSNQYLISDGGAQIPGDFVKALCLSDMVMTGSFFAGAPEVPGEIIEIDGKEFKRYDGSSTIGKNGKRVEGVKSLVPVQMSISHLLDKLIEGIQSGASYQGVNDINKLQHEPVFVRLSHGGTVETSIHDVKVIG